MVINHLLTGMTLQVALAGINGLYLHLQLGGAHLVRIIFQNSLWVLVIIGCLSACLF